MSKNINDIFAKFDVSFESQFEKYKSEGKKVAGTLAAYSPVEIIHAAGIIPLTSWGFEMELAKSKEYFPAFYSTVVQSTLEKALLGEFKGLEFMIIANLSDTLKAVGQNWKRAIDIPVINLAIAQNRKIDAGIKFNHTQAIKAKKKIEDIIGKEIKDEDIEKAIKLFNQNKLKLQEFVELSRKHLDVVTASKRSMVLRSAHYMEKTEHNALLDELNAALKELPECDYKGPKIVTSGIIGDISGLLDIFDDNDIRIVADNVLQESGYYKYLIEENTEDPVKAVSMIMYSAEGTSLLLDADKLRTQYIIEDAEKYGADGFIMIMLTFCDSEEFDYPIMKEKFSEAGLMALEIEVDQQMTSYEQSKTLVQTFAEMI